MTRVTKMYKKTFEEASEFSVTPLQPKREGGRPAGRGSGKPYERPGAKGGFLRGEERRLQRQQVKKDATVCFQCRKPGHAVTDCPENKEKEGTSAVMCYHCGSTSHSIKGCSIPKRGGQLFKFAECFICKEKGHLASKCTKNTKGLYPDGGGCRFCGSVEHYARDCKPASFNNDQSMVLGKMTMDQGGDDDDVFLALHRMSGSRVKGGKGTIVTATASAKPKKKVVHF